MRGRPALAGLLLAVTGAALAPAAPALGIAGGTDDGEGHPAVGGLVTEKPLSTGSYAYCTGTLVSSTVVLTAAHCDDQGAAVRVTFDPAYVPGDEVHTGTFVAHPDYPAKGGDPLDIAVVLLDEPVTDREPAQLPAAGSLGGLGSGTPVVGVGYGASAVDRKGGGRTLTVTDTRQVATATLKAVTPRWLRMSIQDHKGEGGGCFGDSGGPNFIGDVLAATTISGDPGCKSTNVAYRLDTEVARDFLGQHVTLP